MTTFSTGSDDGACVRSDAFRPFGAPPEMQGLEASVTECAALCGLPSQPGLGSPLLLPVVCLRVRCPPPKGGGADGHVRGLRGHAADMADKIACHRYWPLL